MGVGAWLGGAWVDLGERRGILAFWWKDKPGMELWALTHTTGRIAPRWIMSYLHPPWHWALVQMSSQWKGGPCSSSHSGGAEKKQTNQTNKTPPTTPPPNTCELSDLRHLSFLFLCPSNPQIWRLEKLLNKTLTRAVLWSKRWLTLASGVSPRESSTLRLVALVSEPALRQLLLPQVCPLAWAHWLMLPERAIGSP